MNIWNINSILIFVAFVIPGFISIKIYEMLIPGPYSGSNEKIVDAISYSSINYAVFAIPIYFVESSGLANNHKLLYIFFYIFVLFVAPVGWVSIYKYLRENKFIASKLVHPIQKPWDYVFGKRMPYWVLATLNNGVRLGGYYGYDSFASSSPAPPELYLEQAWEINKDGGFERVHDDTNGLLINGGEIQFLELFKVEFDAEKDSQ